VRQQLKALLEAVAAQQAESSASRQLSERGRAGAPSAHGLNPPPSQHQGRSKVVSGPTATSGIPSKPDDKMRASTTIVTTARATTTTVDATVS
jgi:hypothetical protein